MLVTLFAFGAEGMTSLWFMTWWGWLPNYRHQERNFVTSRWFSGVENSPTVQTTCPPVSPESAFPGLYVLEDLVPCKTWYLQHLSKVHGTIWIVDYLIKKSKCKCLGNFSYVTKISHESFLREIQKVNLKSIASFIAIVTISYIACQSKKPKCTQHKWLL